MRIIPTSIRHLYKFSWKPIICFILCFATNGLITSATYAKSSTDYVFDDLTMLFDSSPKSYYATMDTDDFNSNSKSDQYYSFTKKKDKKTSRLKEHPRKKLLVEAPLHTQRAWLYSAVIPGLGQCYNESYWKLLPIYGVLGLLTWGAWYNNNEYLITRREIIKQDTKQQNLKNYMQSRERDRTIFLAGIVVWYILNIFDAYVEGTLKTFDVSDDLSVIFPEPENTPKKPLNNVIPATGVSLNISLQAKNKDEDRSDWVW